MSRESRDIERARRSSSGKPKSVPRAASGLPVHEGLRSFFRALGPLMLREGITAKAVSSMVKQALVAEAARQSSMGSGRVNNSKVAALTGLTRTEVRLMLRRGLDGSNRKRTDFDRITRVVKGWHTDLRFVSRAGKPRALRIGNAKGEFGDLVRRHSGDIPPRVVMEQLVQGRRAKIAKGLVRLIKPPSGNPRGKASQNLPDVTPYVMDVLSAAATEKVKLAFAHRLELYPATDSEGNYLSDRVARALSTTISALGANARQGQLTESQAKLVVSVAVTLHDLGTSQAQE